MRPAGPARPGRLTRTAGGQTRAGCSTRMPTRPPTGSPGSSPCSTPRNSTSSRPWQPGMSSSASL